MKKENMKDLLETLKRIEDTILAIKLYNEDIYNHFSGKVESLEEALINLEDGKDYENVYGLQLIGEVTKLEFEVNHFMKTGRIDDADAELVFEGEGALSGQEMEKQHRISVYKNLAKVIGEMENVDIDRLKKLKEQWDREKGGYNYSEVEANAIEKVLAYAFIQYQIKTCAKEGKFPKEAKEDFCAPEIYESELKKAIVDHASSLSKDSLDRLELESFIINWDLDTILRSERVWEILSGKRPEFPEEIISESKAEPEEIKEEPKPKQEQEEVSTSNLPLNLNEEAIGNAVLIVYEKKLPDGSVELKRKIKTLDEEGRFKLFFNKDRVVELYFLEGTERLKFTKNGRTKSGITRIIRIT